MILCIGTTPAWQRSMAFPRFAVGEVCRTAAVKEYASGKGINAARIVRTLGESTMCLGLAGGERGEKLLRDLRKANIEYDFVPVAAQTRMCITAIDQGSGIATELVEEPGTIPTEAYTAMQGKIAAHLEEATGVIGIGSLPAGIPTSFYGDVAKQFKVPVVIDARGEPLKKALPAGKFIAKLNREELELTVEGPLADEQAVLNAMRTLCPAGGAIVVTLGRDGALMFDGKQIWRAIAPEVKTISAVGSGDAFAAGLIVGMVRNLGTAATLKLATACGAANAGTAYAGHADLDAIERLVGKARVEAVG